MSGALNVLAGFLGTIGLLVIWFLLLIVIPGIIAVYASSLFPMSGQWRKRWAERGRQSRP